METTIRINTDQLTTDLLESIKKMFPHKLVEITIQSVDETDYILSNPAYTSELRERITEHNLTKETIRLKSNFMEAFGAFDSEKSAEEIIEEIRSSRTFNS